MAKKKSKFEPSGSGAGMLLGEDMIIIYDEDLRFIFKKLQDENLKLKALNKALSEKIKELKKK